MYNAFLSAFFAAQVNYGGGMHFAPVLAGAAVERVYEALYSISQKARRHHKKRRSVSDPRLAFSLF
jgi:hypothetical protein